MQISRDQKVNSTLKWNIISSISLTVFVMLVDVRVRVEQIWSLCKQATLNTLQAPHISMIITKSLVQNVLVGV